jgi:4a-hydroxytetrahydrobiopterin dehydratase
MTKLTLKQIQAELSSAARWKKKGNAVTRTFEFKDFVAAMKFVNAVARAAEKTQHHPDIDIRWNKVRLLFTTHDAGGLTEKDFAMARECDRLGK